MQVMESWVWPGNMKQAEQNCKNQCNFCAKSGEEKEAYCIAGKFDRELNLLVLQSGLKMPI